MKKSGTFRQNDLGLIAVFSKRPKRELKAFALKATAGTEPSLLNEACSAIAKDNSSGHAVNTRAINAAAAALMAFFDAAAHDVTRTLLGPRPQLVEAYRRHRRSDARGEDAAAALFGIATQGPHHDAAQRFVETLTAEHSLRVFDALLRVDGLPSASELEDPAAWYERVTNSPLA